MTSTPCAMALCTNGFAHAMPGLMTIMSCCGMYASGACPSANAQSISCRKASCPSKALSSLRSLIVTFAPSSHSRRAAAMPLRAMPQTSTRFPFTSIMISCLRYSTPSRVITQRMIVVTMYIMTIFVSWMPHSSK